MGSQGYGLAVFGPFFVNLRNFRAPVLLNLALVGNCSGIFLRISAPERILPSFFMVLLYASNPDPTTCRLIQVKVAQVNPTVGRTPEGRSRHNLEAPCQNPF